MAEATVAGGGQDRRRWVLLWVIGLAQLMVVLDPTVLSLLTTTFTEPKDRNKAFGIYGAIVGTGGAIGLLLGGSLTEYLSWRWTLYVNLIFAGVAFTGGALLLGRHPSSGRPRLDI